MSLGIIVLGHGSRAIVGEANKVTFQITDMVKAKMQHDLIETAIMNRESGLQGISEAVAKLVAGGAKNIKIVPMFLTNGMHIKSDIPEEIEALSTEYPGVTISMTGHIGADPRIADILVERIREAL